MQAAFVNVYKKIFLALLICGLLIYVPKMSKEANTTKYILYWTPFWRVEDYYLGFGFKPFQQCKSYKNCYATNNRSMLPLEEFDAIFFHANTYNKTKHGVPWIRSPHQRYVFVNIETPVNSCPNLKQYNLFFNWTMTYRFDSDIVMRYGTITMAKTKSQEFLNNKTKMAAWFVSHCNTSSKREYLVKEIQKHISVDVFGSCGPLSCARKGVVSHAKCYGKLEKNYKFYLSFENSYCRDYASEKLYRVLKRDVLPVVYGGADYKVIAPSKSVINVEDFQDAQQLANYLTYLNQHQDEYLKYFEWKKRYRITSGTLSTICEICKKLHEPVQESIYYDLHKWWWGDNTSGVCKTGKQLPKIVSDVKPEES